RNVKKRPAASDLKWTYCNHKATYFASYLTSGDCVPCFFFSSKRRHTRSYGDWSSDVCSSDLLRVGREGKGRDSCCHQGNLQVFKIGRASCRERLYIVFCSVVVKRKISGCFKRVTFSRYRRQVSRL